MKKYLIVLMLFTVACTAHGQLTTETVVTTGTLNKDWFSYIILDTNLDGNGLILNESIESLLGSGLTFDTLTDADGDTMVQVEESADEDTIRFDAGGIAIMGMTETYITLHKWAVLNDKLSVTGATVLGTLNAIDAVTFDDTLRVTDATTLNDTLTVAGIADLNSTLDVAGTATLSNALVVSGVTTLSGSLAAKTSTALGIPNYALLVSTDGYLSDQDDAVTVNDDLYISGSLGVGISVPISPFHLYEDTAATGATVGLTIEQDNASGDALLQFLLTGGQRYVMGIDTNGGGQLRISPTTDLSSGPFWGMNSTGLILSHSVGDNLGQYQLTSDRDGDEEDLYELGFWGISDGPDSAQYAAIRGYIVDNANTSEDGGISLWTSVDGTATETLTVRRDNVGIGELTPADKLEIQGGGIIVDGSTNIDWSIDGHNMFHTSDNTSASGWAGGNATNAGANIALFGGTHATLANICRWRVGATEVMRLDANGDLSIGTAASGAYRLDVFVSTEDYIAKLFNDGGATTNKGLLIQMGEDTSSGQSIPLDIADGNGTLEGGIELNNGVVAIYNVSDQRLKDDITTTVLVASDVLNALKVRDFTWKGGSVRSTGFVAQEVAAVYPVMAGERTYTRQLETGTTQTLTSDTGTTYTTWVWDKETTTVATVTQSRLFPVLVKAFQEQDKVVVGQGLEIIRQQQTIDMLTGEVAELWAENMEMNARLERLEALLLNR